MANEIQQKKEQSLQSLMNSGAVMKKLNDVLGSEKKAASFVSSVISVANGNSMLRNCNPMTILGSAMVAATLDLPVVPTLGLAYIVPYKGQCQFQLGYKGLIELAERSGQFRNIIDEVVYEGQLVKKNKFTGEYEFDEDAKTSDRVIGYMARMDLVNGFSKTIFWTREEVEKHAGRFSQAYKSGYNSPWKTDFDAMARKTVLKALFAKYAPKSVAIQQAVKFDQAIVRPNDTLTDADLQIDTFEAEYVDNEPVAEVATEEVDPSKGLFPEEHPESDGEAKKKK
jgi:recombination protein RecT